MSRKPSGPGIAHFLMSGVVSGFGSPTGRPEKARSTHAGYASSSTPREASPPRDGCRQTALGPSVYVPSNQICGGICGRRAWGLVRQTSHGYSPYCRTGS